MSAPGRHVLYFALQPPADAAAAAHRRLEALRARGGLTARAIAASRLHVSLHPLGAFRRPPGAVVEKAAGVVEGLAARPFVISFNRIGAWPSGASPWPVTLWGDEGVIGADALQASLHRALVRAAMASRREARITPHMTLAYDRGHAPETLVEPVSWRVTEFVLVHAVHGEGRYDIVGRFPLSG